MIGYTSHNNRRIYLSITDHINEYPYKLTDIPSYTEELSDYELDPFTGGPIRNPIYGEVSCGMYTINWMIQAYHDQIPFSFEKPSDVCHVTWKLNEYVNELKNRPVPLNKNEQMYLDKAIVFLSEMKKNAKIVLARRNKLRLPQELEVDKLFKQLSETLRG